MKKISLISIVTFLLISLDASAQDIASFKAQVIASLNKEKAIIDTEISCVNLIKTKEDFQQCRVAKKTAMEAVRAKRQAMSGQRFEKNREGKINEKITPLPTAAAKQ